MLFEEKSLGKLQQKKQSHGKLESATKITYNLKIRDGKREKKRKEKIAQLPNIKVSAWRASKEKERNLYFQLPCR